MALGPSQVRAVGPKLGPWARLGAGSDTGTTTCLTTKYKQWATKDTLLQNIPPPGAQGGIGRFIWVSKHKLREHYFDTKSFKKNQNHCKITFKQDQATDWWPKLQNGGLRCEEIGSWCL